MLENQKSPLKYGVNGNKVDMELRVFKELFSLKPISNSTHSSNFARKMERRVLKVKEVCANFHETYNGRYV